MTLDRASQLGYLTFALTLAADQMTKFAILEVADDRAWSVTVTGFFNLVLVFNKGVSFGLFGGAGLPYQHLILSGIAIVVGLVLLNWLRQDLGQRLSLAYALIAGGAIGNAIDRLRIGAVVDFLDLHYAGQHWPAFNVADSAIVIGVLLVIADALFGSGEKSKKDVDV